MTSLLFYVMTLEDILKSVSVHFHLSKEVCLREGGWVILISET